MARTLFESLTGYEEPSGQDAGMPQLLGAAGTDESEEPKEDDFPEILERLRNQSNTDKQFAKKLHDAFGITDETAVFKDHLEKARQIVAKSRESALLGAGPADFSQQEKDLRAPQLLGVPKDFSEDYIEKNVVARYRQGFPSIDLDPSQPRFEDDTPLGIVGWLVFNGPGAVAVPRKLEPPFAEEFGKILGAEKFRRHGATQFVHTLRPADGQRLRVALFADFGTGLAHSRFIARQIQVDPFDAAIHLGDVYYTGTKKQYENYFEKPLEPVLQKGTDLFVIPDNHDGYSGFHAYVSFLDRRLKQKGSYFAIETEHVQFIGVDTIWHSERGRIQDSGVRDWLKARFAAGRANGRANVLLTGAEPYEYEKTEILSLNQDVRDLANGALDLWFWGNTHYCALFDRTTSTPFYGSCIGHGGYPYKRRSPKEAAKPSAVPVLFAEGGTRYEGSTVRTDRGMNGFCSFEVDPAGSVELHYRDWRGQERCIVKFAKAADGSLTLASPVDDRTGGR